MMTVALLGSCSEKEGAEKLGSIHGIVTEKSAIAEPMRGTGVELYYEYDNSLLLRTTTYDDGRYEFNDLHAGNYELIVDATGYEKLTHRVVVEAGRIARGDMQLEKINTEMTVRTLDITDIGGNFATLNGSYVSSYSVNECGFVYAKNSTPINGGTKITASLDDNFSKTITGLEKETYYVQAYATNSRGTEYGEVRSFQIVGNPSVTTLAATNITANTATLNGKIVYAGDPAYTERGFVYSSSFTNPSIDDNEATIKRTVSGTSTDFGVNISGLTEEKMYYVRAFVTNSNGTVYGKSVIFKPTDNPSFVTLHSAGLMVQKTDIGSGGWYSMNSLCNNSTLDGYTGWRMPTINELTAMYNERNMIGGFADYYYWSSTIAAYASTYNCYYILDFDGGTRYDTNQGSDFPRCRCVRSLP